MKEHKSDVSKSRICSQSLPSKVTILKDGKVDQRDDNEHWKDCVADV